MIKAGETNLKQKWGEKKSFFFVMERKKKKNRSQRLEGLLEREVNRRKQGERKKLWKEISPGTLPTGKKDNNPRCEGKVRREERKPKRETPGKELLRSNGFTSGLQNQRSEGSQL